MEKYRLKIMEIKALKAERGLLRDSGKRVVFTNGCFDILHPGHSRYLSAARGLGDHLIVAVNSDRSVKRIKGPKRPVFSEDARAEMLAALSFVDRVIIFDEETPLELITLLLPDILVKGGDWGEDEIVGADVVKAAGGEVRRISFVDGYSTTGIIERILSEED